MYDTIVVGLGVSGATILSMLAQKGVKVLGLEAASRIGGRVNTVPFGQGVIELGAEWIHGTENSAVYDLVERHNVNVIPQDISFSLYRSDGSEGDSNLNELVDCCLAAVANKPEKPEPLGQFTIEACRKYLLENRPELLQDVELVTEFFEFMNLYTCNFEASNDWDDVTTESNYTELDGHQHMSWHKSGYKTLFDIILKTYNNGSGIPNAKIELNKEVTKIIYPSDPKANVTVKCGDGTTYEASNVVVTVSLGVLKEKHATMFSPPLPIKKVKAIDNMSIGVMDKVMLSFDQSWWPTSKTFFGFIWKTEDRLKVPVEDLWTTGIFGATRPMGSDNVITLWTSGDIAKLVETLPEDVVKRKSLELLRKFLGKNRTIPEPTGMIRSTWYSNPLTRGSYSYDSIQNPRNSESRIHLSEPLLDSAFKPRVLFAGEATNPTHFSTVHGAMETGLREANRILEKVQSKL